MGATPPGPTAQLQHTQRTTPTMAGVFSKNNLFLVIEDAPSLTHEDKNIFARQFRAGASTPLDETIADKISYIYAQKIVSSGFQYYSAKDLHRRSHYMVDGPGLKKIMESCAGLKLTPPVEIIPAIVPEMDFRVEPEVMIHLKSILEKSGKVNPRGNIVVTHGYSGQNMRCKRAEGGRPELTQYMSSEIKKFALPVLEYLTKRIGLEGYTPRGGKGRFADALCPGNFFEAVAVALTRGPEVRPHMDRENDYREGYSIMGALTFSGHDAKGAYRVGVFGYTRKCVGDYLDWEAKQAVSVSRRRIEFQK